MTLRQIASRWGTMRAFRDHLDALKKIEDTRGKRLENDETEGQLISRELVKSHVFSAIESSNRRLLRDVPRTATRRLYANAKSRIPLEESETLVRDLIGSVLLPTKETLVRVLRNGE